MKLFIIFFLLFSVSSYGAGNPFYQKVVKARQGQSDQQTNSSELEGIHRELQEDIKMLLFTLTHEHTSEEHKLEIIKMLSKTAILDKEITEALEETISRGSECKNENEKEGCRIFNMVGLRAHVELMRMKTLAVTQKNRESWNYYKDMALDGLLVITGVGLFFVPVGGPALSTALFTIRFGKFTGSTIVTAIGLYRVGEQLTGEEKENSVFELIKTAALKGVFAQAIFHLAQLGDEELLERVIFSSTEGEVVNILSSVIEDTSYSAETRRVAIETLLVFPNTLQIRRAKIIKLLKGVIDNEDNNQDFRTSAVKVLGEVGEGVSEVAEYLEKKGDDINEKDQLRLVALIHLGRNKSALASSIRLLANLLKDRNYKKDPLEVQEIPDSFLDSLLVNEKENQTEDKKKEELSENHIIVLREFILSGMLDFYLKLRFSATLSLDESPDSKSLLTEIYSERDSIADLRAYMEKLSKEGEFEDSQKAFNFLKESIASVKGVPAKQALDLIKSAIEQLETASPDQIELTEKISTFVESYERVLQSIKK